ncbi:tetraacyldisaccharide 4'-kinase [Motiliproteus sp. MSK22-1]|uniref:tetraacyldisaccharide 4'-kinase n=1 Tax=Motiliproteus sp. MSK22-1 TaxID=1897630 RepID=UPI0009764767|nr:tetraacyldisaccharide 4'-kinase [Motiliproteus sp. MSK22-1]OMH25257.1 tetraacyldisaccharide 4'-kinase [Motiliproteus sp. MSK22-1]
MSFIDRVWYGKIPWLLPLWPVEKLFVFLAHRRRTAFGKGLKTVWQAPVPVIVVGNISVGGVGKTPVVVHLVELLIQFGFRPGVVSRGYGGNAPDYPYRVVASSNAADSGDEPLMIAQRCGCPVVVDPDRAQACRALLESGEVDVIISDDGLQHYRLSRDIEIAVVDGARGLGNGHCLPVGPLREPPARLDEVDFCIVNGGGWKHCNSYPMSLNVSSIQTLLAEPVQLLPGKVNAVAGIGNPQRFFKTLRSLGFEVIEHSFADHHHFSANDLLFDNDFPVIMTEKDAVKCRAFAADNRYYLPVSAELPEVFEKQLLDQLNRLISN